MIRGFQLKVFPNSKYQHISMPYMALSYTSTARYRSTEDDYFVTNNPPILSLAGVSDDSWS